MKPFMRTPGFAVVLGSLALAGLMIVLWLAGVVFNFGGSLIHLLLVFAPLVGFAGVAVGVVLILVASRRPPQP